MKRVGVLTDTSLFKQGEYGLHEFPCHPTGTAILPHFFSMAEMWHLDQLWVHHSYTDTFGEPDYPMTQLWDILPRTPDLAHWYHGFRPERHGDGIDVCFPSRRGARGEVSSWARAETGRELLEQILSFNAALGYDYARSPGATGTGLMREVHGGGKGVDRRFLRLNLVHDVPEPARLAHPYPARDIEWIRRLTEDECQMGWLHSFDKNASYLGAAAALELGLGDWEHVDEAGVWGKDIAKCPGYYHVTSEHRLADWNLPGILDPDGYIAAHPGNGIWAMAPAVSASMQAGNIISIDEAYIWPEHHRVLAPWQARLRDAYNTLPRGTIARDVVKEVYTRAIGWLDGDWNYEPDAPASMLFRPDWRHAIIAQAAANIWRQCIKAVQSGVSVVAIGGKDRVYVVSDELDAAEVARKAGFTLGVGIGQWKITDHAVPLAEVTPCFEDVVGYAKRKLGFHRLEQQLARRKARIGERTGERVEEGAHVVG